MQSVSSHPVYGKIVARSTGEGVAMRQERGLIELFADDPERADALVFGRRVDRSRRGFLKGAGLAAMSAALGGVIPFARYMPGGLIPVGLIPRARAQEQAAEPKLLEMPGKAPLLIIQERPLVAETPAHMLDDDVTPNDKYFIRNNGLSPEAPADPEAWKVTVDGEVNKPLELALGDLERRFASVSYQLQLECGGNGRAFFVPETRGNQFGHGAIGNAEWSGVRLKDVLKAAGLKPGAVYTAHYGADRHLSGDPGKLALSRGVRLEKAMEEHTLIALRMNGQPIPPIHGGPARLIVPGWPGSASQKWLTRISIRDREHNGPGMTGFSYRLPMTPIVPGSKGDETKTRILESMPVRSIITNIANGTRLAAGTRTLAVRGAAWAGEKTVRALDVSIDYGQTWAPAQLAKPANAYAWQRWRTSIRLPTFGYYEIWARATDSDGKMQPPVAPDWNPQGYGGNPFHRVAILAEA
jgi:DMSO/TMAO reductase YedYZ molybdopterin-dependent catalytic subunit